MTWPQVAGLAFCGWVLIGVLLAVWILFMYFGEVIQNGHH